MSKSRWETPGWPRRFWGGRVTGSSRAQQGRCWIIDQLNGQTFSFFCRHTEFWLREDERRSHLRFPMRPQSPGRQGYTTNLILAHREGERPHSSADRENSHLVTPQTEKNLRAQTERENKPLSMFVSNNKWLLLFLGRSCYCSSKSRTKF